MRTRRNNAFTLVEILIVVVILGILAAIVVPQFTNASQEAIKGALASQLQTVSAQVELYRVQNAGNLPHADIDPVVAGGSNGGWGVLVEADYLKSQPNNGYARSTMLANIWLPGPFVAPAATGWAYDNATGEVFAHGYDPVNNLLANEAGYVNVPPF